MLVLASQHAEARLQDGPPTDNPSERLEVVALDIEGARAVSESDLQALLKTRKTSRLPWRERAYFDPAVFEADLRRIETFYAERGYPHARAEGVIDQRPNETRLRIVLHEGEPVRAVQVVFSGFNVLPVDQVEALEDAAALQPGELVATADVEATVRGAVTALWNAGYPDARVEALETVVAPDRVRIDIRAAPGLQAVFGPIDIEGNLTVEDSLIRRQITYLPGERFEAAALQESQRRLFQLGLFESVDITVVDRENASSGVATRVTVVERDPTQFTYSFGYGSEEHAYGEAGWRHLNFLGGGRTVSTRGKWSWLDRGAEGTFNQPYLFRSGLAFTASAYVWHFDEAPYESLARGGRAGVNYQVGRNTLTSTYVHEFLSVQVPTDAQQTGLLSALQFGAERHTAVESAGTTQGYAAAARLEHAGAWLPGSFNYLSVSGDGRYYHAIARVTLAGRIQYGSIVPKGPRSDVPFSRRYFLGGADSLRGWGRLEVSPLSAAGLPIGGQSLFATTGEVRVPVLGPVGAVVFADAGKVWEDAWALSADLLADGGVGVRYRSPFALLRFDAAYQFTTVRGLRIDDDRRDRRWRIHFGIGHSF